MRQGFPTEAIATDDPETGYEREAERLVDVKKNDAYAQAVELMRHIAGLLDRAGRSGEFADYVAQVRAAHKRNLMAMLDQAGW